MSDNSGYTDDNSRYSALRKTHKTIGESSKGDFRGTNQFVQRTKSAIPDNMDQSGFADRVRNDRLTRLGTDVHASDMPDDEKLTDLDRSVNTGMV